MRHRWIALALTIGVSLGQTSAHAWDSTGHRAVAYIAYKQLKEHNPEILQRVVVVLQSHPAASTKLWKHGKTNGADSDLNLFLNAATFPDDVRSGHLTPHTAFNDDKFKVYQHGNDHFVNFRFRPTATDPANLEPDGVAAGGTLVPTYATRVKAVRTNDPGELKNDDGTPESRAVSLSWIFHQVGDVHQPLHAAARFSQKFNGDHGDEGGNLVKLSPAQRGADELHAYWDGLLGSDHDVDTPEKLASIGDAARAAFPVDGFPANALKPADDLTPWAMESFRLAVQEAYVPLVGHGLDSEQGVDSLPEGYEATAVKTARRRVAQAGYRLAAELKALFADSADAN